MPSPPMTATRCLVLTVPSPRPAESGLKLKNRPQCGRFKARVSVARLVNNAYKDLGAVHDHTILSQPGRVRQHCPAAGESPCGGGYPGGAGAVPRTAGRPPLEGHAVTNASANQTEPT